MDRDYCGHTYLNLHGAAINKNDKRKKGAGCIAFNAAGFANGRLPVGVVWVFEK